MLRKAYTDYEMIAVHERGVVCIATPTTSHKDVTIAAATSGLDIFCEKPMADNLSEARDMLELVNKQGICFGMGFKMRYESVFATAKEYLEEGKLGPVEHIFLNFFQPLPDVDWYLDEGIIAGLLVHPMDLANWFLGAQPQSVKASVFYKQGRKGEDQAFLEFNYGNDRKALINGGYVTGFPQIAGDEDFLFEIICDRGYIVGRRPNLLMIRDQKETFVKVIKPVNAFKRELELFFTAVSEGKKPPVDINTGFITQTMIDMAKQSASLNGEEVEIKL